MMLFILFLFRITIYLSCVDTESENKSDAH